MEQPVIEMKGLTKRYRNGRGCFDMNLTVKQGSIFGLLGPNGAGKSTLIKTLVGLMRPTAGEAWIMGFPIGAIGAKKQVGYLPELFRYQDWLTPREILQFHGYLHTGRRSFVHSESFNKRMEEVLEAVGLKAVMNQRVKSFSKGMQQRLGLACAMVMDPDILILDEPSSALDPIGRREIRELLVNLKDRGKTIFLNTHLLEDVEMVCDEAALLYQGKIRAFDQVQNIVEGRKVWLLRVGGWSEELVPLIKGRGLADVSLKVKREREHRTELEVRVENEEEIGWLNTVLADLGVTVYEARPHVKQLEDWFLSKIGNGVSS